jgi:inner membrane protein
MEPVTHLLTGACLARAGFNRKAAYATLAMTLAAEMPDLDTLWSVGGPIAGFEHHRGITHTFIGLPFEGLLVVGAVWLLHRTRVRRAQRLAPAQPSTAHTTDQPIIRPLTAAPVRWPLLYGFILIALLSHILLDWTNNYGVRPFFPFNPHWYAGSFVFIFEPVMFLLLLIGLIAPALFGLIAREVGVRKPTFRGRGWAIFALISIAALWGWRLIEHDAAVQLASVATYGPADSPSAEILRITASPYPINPFRWHTVVDTPAFYQMATADTLHAALATDPAQDLFYKPPATPAIQTAKQSRLGRAYLDWSSWTLVTEAGPTAPIGAPPGTPDWNAISFRDLRFLYDTPLIQGRENPPLSALVYLDASGHVVRMELGGHAQR